MKRHLALTVSALFWFATASAQSEPGLSGGEQNKQQPSEAKAPVHSPAPHSDAPQIIRVALEVPGEASPSNGAPPQITVTSGTVEDAQQSAAAAKEIAAQREEIPGTPAPDVVAFNSEGQPSALQKTFAQDVAAAAGASLNSPAGKSALPWYFKETPRRLTFAVIRAVVDGGVTFVVVTSHQALPLPVASAYASVGGVLSGVMQFFNKELLNWLSKTTLLDQLEKRGWQLPTPIRGAVAHMEYIVRWMTMDGLFLGLSASSMVAAAAYYGMHASASDLLSVALFGEISFWAATAEGMSDRLIIKKQTQWEIQHANEIHRARFKTDLLSGLNSCLAVVLALPSLAGIQVTEVLLKGYALTAGVLLVRDWTIAKVHSIKGWLKERWSPRPSCEKEFRGPDHRAGLFRGQIGDFALT